MESTALESKLPVCAAALLAAILPLLFVACGGGIVGVGNNQQQSSSVAIKSVVPNSGPPAGGTAVIINGTNLTSAAQLAAPSVRFGGIAATQVTVISSTQVKAVIPAHSAGTVSVEVTAGDGGTSTLANAFTYGSTTFSVNSVSPISGPANGGSTVTISGSNFQSGASVTFGGLAATSVTVSNSATIVAVTPPHASGAADVTVTDSNGQSAALSSGFTFHSVVLAWSAPTSSPVTVTGYNIYRALSSTGPFAKLNGSSPVANTSYDDGSVQGATSYFYEVTSVDSKGTESAPEGPVRATTGP